MHIRLTLRMSIGIATLPRHSREGGNLSGLLQVLSLDGALTLPQLPKQPCVHLLANKPNGTLYIGVTGSLFDRMVVHREGFIDGFTKKYNVHRLVYYEMHATMGEAIRREKQLKKRKRLWKLRLIEQMNPTWSDLFDEENGIAEREGGQDRSSH